MMKGLRSDPRLGVSHGVPGTIFALLRTALGQQPDYLHLDWIHQYYLRGSLWKTYLTLPLFYFEIWFISRFTSVRLVWTLHNLSPHGSSKKDKIAAQVRRYLAARVEFIRLFADCSVERAAEYLQCDRSKFRVVPEGSYVGYYPDTTTESAAKEKLGFPTDRRVMVNVGTIRPYKGLEKLIAAFSEIDDPDWMLVIAGAAWDRPYTDSLQQLAASSPAAERIVFHLGIVPDEKLQYYLRAADLAVFPFKSIENSGSVILAMGFGLPVVTGNLGVPATRLSAQNRFLYEVNLTKTLTEAMLHSPEQLRAIGQRNLQQLERHRWKDFAQVFV